MKLIIALSAFIALSRAGQIYQGTSQTGDDYAHQTADINQLANLQQNGYQTDQYQANNYNNNYQANNILNNARILSYQSDKSDYGYQYGYETDNGIKAEEVGQNQGKGHVVQGAYSYTGDDGQVYTVTYTADENGFHPQGAHLPTPPPTPEAILKSLEKNALDEANGIFDDGSYKENPHQYEAQQQNQELQQQYSQGQNQYSQGQNQHSQGQNQYNQEQFQFSQGQHQVSQSQPQYVQGQQYQQLQAPRYQPSGLGQEQSTGLAAKYQPSAPAVKLPATGQSTVNYNSGSQFQGYQISAPSGSGHY